MPNNRILTQDVRDEIADVLYRHHEAYLLFAFTDEPPEDLQNFEALAVFDNELVWEYCKAEGYPVVHNNLPHYKNLLTAVERSALNVAFKMKPYFDAVLTGDNAAIAQEGAKLLDEGNPQEFIPALLENIAEMAHHRKAELARRYDIEEIGHSQTGLQAFAL